MCSNLWGVIGAYTQTIGFHHGGLSSQECTDRRMGVLARIRIQLPDRRVWVLRGDDDIRGRSSSQNLSVSLIRVASLTVAS